MSTKTITLNNSLDTVSIGYITMGDTIVVNVGTGFDKATHYKLRIIDSFGLEVWLPSESDYTTQTQFTYTFEDRANSSYLNAWGSGFVVSLRAYEQRVTKWDTWYSSVGSGIASGILQVDVSKYRPTMSFSNVVATNTYNGLALAGISKLQATLSTGHLNSSDKANLNEPKLLVYSDSFEGYRPVTKDDTTIVSTNELPTSTDKYYAWFKGYIQDSRYVYQDGTKGLMPWTMDIPRTPAYVESSKVLVYPYALPTYDPNYTYVNRCAASGRPDGAGNYARIRITYDISVVDGTNKLSSLVVKLSNKSNTETPVNSDYLTSGYADFIISISSSSEASVTVTMTDSVCVALGTSSSFTLYIPTATLPLSLFDDGTNRGTSFGQMATRPGNWFYNNLVYVNNNIPYLLDIHKNTLVARPLCGDNGKSTVRIHYKLQGTLTYEYYLCICKYDLTTIVIDPSKAETSGYFDVPIGTLLLIYMGSSPMSDGKHSLYANGTKISDDSHLFTTTTSGTPVYYFTPTENTDIEAWYHASSYTPSVSDNRPTITVTTSTANQYSFSDNDNVHVSDNTNLVLRGASDVACSFTINQQSVNKVFTKWLIGSSENFNETLVQSFSSSTTITCVFEDGVKLTISGISNVRELVIRDRTHNKILTNLSNPSFTSNITYYVSTIANMYIWYVSKSSEPSIYINGTRYRNTSTYEVTIASIIFTSDASIVLA